MGVHQLGFGRHGSHGSIGTSSGGSFHLVFTLSGSTQNHVSRIDRFHAQTISVIDNDVGNALQVHRTGSPSGGIHKVVHTVLQSKLCANDVHEDRYLNVGTKFGGETKEAFQFTQQIAGIGTTASTLGGDFLDFSVEDCGGQSLLGEDRLGGANSVVVLRGDLVRFSLRNGLGVSFLHVLLLFLLGNDGGVLFEPAGTTLEFSVWIVFFVGTGRIIIATSPIRASVVVLIVATVAVRIVGIRVVVILGFLLLVSVRVIGISVGIIIRRATGTRATRIISIIIVVLIIIIHGILAVMFHDNGEWLVVLFQSQLHPVQGTSLARRELLKGRLIGQPFRNVRFQIHQYTDQEPRHSLRQRLFGLYHRLG
mmetsp:Transcript_118559/g.177188  ORF Transcript_118559/g.177188 Transcript_118559/m.177188 type:complete len:366 (-) Transcript_118559:64-1161(-)